MVPPATNSRLAITGIGAVPAERFSADLLPAKRGSRYLSAATRFALAAARTALEDAGLWDADPYPPESRGVCLGTNFAVEAVVEDMDRVVLSGGAPALLAIETPNFSANIAASYVSLACRFLAVNLTVTDRFVAGLTAIDLGTSCIRRGRARLVLAGGVDGPIPPAFSAACGGAESAGGACLFVLEPMDEALARGARPRAELLEPARCFLPPASAATSDAWRPHEDRLLRAIDARLSDGASITAVVPNLESRFVRRITDTLSRHAGGRAGAIECRVAGVAAGGCLAPVFWLADSIGSCGETLVVAPSPHGEVALLGMRPAAPHRATASTAGCTSSRPALV
jgi:hypothetical protein